MKSPSQESTFWREMVLIRSILAEELNHDQDDASKIFDLTA